MTTWIELPKEIEKAIQRLAVMSGVLDGDDVLDWLSAATRTEGRYIPVAGPDVLHPREELVLCRYQADEELIA